MTAFCLMAGLSYFMLAAVRLRSAFLLFVGILPFVPAYIAIPLGIGGAGISLRRIFTYILCLVVTLLVAAKPSAWKGVIHWLSEHKNFVIALLVLFLAKLLSTIMSGELVRTLYWLDEVAETSLILCLAIRYVSDLKTLRTLCLTITLSLLLTEILVFFEFYLQHPLLQDIIDLQVSTVGEDVLAGRERGDSYRVQGLFDNPLSLSEFSILGASFALAYAFLSPRKWLGMLVFACVLPVILMTYSRSGIIVFVLFLTVPSILIFFEGMPLFLKPISKLFLGISLMGGIYFIYQMLTSPETLMLVANLFSDTEGAKASVFERARQYIVVSSAVSESPLIGFGLRNNVTRVLESNLDNYFLRVLLEGGCLGLMGFTFQLWYFYSGATRVMPISISAAMKGTMLWWALAFIVVFSSYKLFASMNFNNIYFYLAVGILFGLSGSSDFKRGVYR